MSSTFRVGMEIGESNGSTVILTRQFQRALADLERGQVVAQPTSSESVLLSQSQPTDAPVSYYLSDAPTQITAFTAYNASGGAATLDVWLDLTGTAGAVASTKAFSASIGASSTQAAPLQGHALPVGAKIYLQSVPAGALTVTISGQK